MKKDITSRKSMFRALIVFVYLWPMLVFAEQHRPHFCEQDHRFFDWQVLGLAEDEFNEDPEIHCPICDSVIKLGNDLKIPRRERNPFPTTGDEREAMDSFQEWVRQNAPRELALGIKPIDAHCSRHRGECRVRLSTGLKSPKEIQGFFIDKWLYQIEGLSKPIVHAFISTSSNTEINHGDLNGYFLIKGTSQTEFYVLVKNGDMFSVEPVTAVLKADKKTHVYEFKCGAFVFKEAAGDTIYGWHKTQGVLLSSRRSSYAKALRERKKDRLVMQSESGHDLELVLKGASMSWVRDNKPFCPLPPSRRGT